MMTVHEVSALTGVTVRALQYYDRLGLLSPAARSEAGYRLYDDAALERLQQIMFFRELEFPLRDIRRILSSPDFDRDKALAQQIELLTLRREHLDKLIALARAIREKGEHQMDFKPFDKSTLDDYTTRAKEAWGDTEAWREYEQKAQKRSSGDEQTLAGDFMDLFRDFGAVKALDPASPEVQAKVASLQSFISEHYYHCSDEILSGLGKMYGADNEFSANIDAAGGEGTAAFVSRAIEIYCKR